MRDASTCKEMTTWAPRALTSDLPAAGVCMWGLNAWCHSGSGVWWYGKLSISCASCDALCVSHTTRSSGLASTSAPSPRARLTAHGSRLTAHGRELHVPPHRLPCPKIRRADTRVAM